jgi:uncharacterized protein
VTIVVDTSVLFAGIRTADDHFAVCSRFLREQQQHLVVPAAILPELDYLLNRGEAQAHPRLFQHVLDDICSGALMVVELEQNRYPRVRELYQKYADLPLGFVDAAVVVTCEQLEADQVATLDSDFRVVVPAHARFLHLLPEGVRRRRKPYGNHEPPS